MQSDLEGERCGEVPYYYPFELNFGTRSRRLEGSLPSGTTIETRARRSERYEQSQSVQFDSVGTEGLLKFKKERSGSAGGGLSSILCTRAQCTTEWSLQLLMRSSALAAK
jgi:hypothetical protein